MKSMQDKLKHYATKIKLWIKAHPRSTRIIAGVIGIYLLIAGAGTWFIWSHRNEPVQLGVSFSVKYAQELGLDWQETYTALLDDAGFKKLRLMSYWDTIEQEPGVFTFDDLDWQMDEAAKRGATVSLAIGQRQPRWPECHLPGWSLQLDKSSYEAAVLSMLDTVVTRYRDHPALESYQLENESRNRHFGLCDAYNFDVYEDEVSLVKNLDQNTPLIINVSNQSGIPLRQPVGDRTGFSVYQRAYFEAAGRSWRWSYAYVPGWWHGARAWAVETLHGSQPFIHELQAEPWGPRATKDLSLVEQDDTMNADKLINSIKFGRSTGMSTMYLWGGEWWYWRLTEFNDDSLWNTAKNQLITSQKSLD